MKTLSSETVAMPATHPALAAFVFVLAAATTLGLFVLFASALIALPTGSPL